MNCISALNPGPGVRILPLPALLVGLALLAAPAAAQPRLDDADADTDDLERLVADLTVAFAPRYIANRILTLSADRGATTVPHRRPALGAVWIREAHAAEVGPREIRLHAELFGWRWIDRTTEVVGAGFSLDQYVKFTAAVTLTGRIDTRYDPSRHLLTLQLSPTRPAETSFAVTNDLQVRSEGLWATLIGGAATLVGHSSGK